MYFDTVTIKISAEKGERRKIFLSEKDHNHKLPREAELELFREMKNTQK